MKKLYVVLILLVGGVSFAQAQDYKKFKAGIGIGYGIPDGGSGGVILYLEPMYRIMDELAVGLRIESAAFAGTELTGLNTSTGVFGIGSFTLNGQYYFGNGMFRPFVGAGFGMYSIAAASADIGSSNVSITAATTVFGFYPRIGVDIGHFNLTIDYNLLPEQSTQVDLGALGIQTVTTKYGYIGFKIGASIGGGKN